MITHNPLHGSGQLEIPLQLLTVVSPRLPVRARRGFFLQREVGHAQRFQVIDVVQKRREPQLPILLCCLTVARSPVNASTPPSRAALHDSGPMWVANPLSCDFFIHYNLAGLTGAQECDYG